MDWFNWFAAVVAHICWSRRYDYALGKERYPPLSAEGTIIRQPNRTVKACVWKAPNPAQVALRLGAYPAAT